MSSSEPSSRSPLYKFWVVLFVLAIALVSALPAYFTGTWVWANEPELTNIRDLRELQQHGLSLPGWRTEGQNVLEIGGHRWSVQEMTPDTSAQSTTNPNTNVNSVVLLMRPQTWHRDLPQVDWMDINGAQQWTADSQRTLQFSVDSPLTNQPVSITARFLRGWGQQRTYAVVQWYAWADGGSPAPSQWFWADQWSQLRDRDRTSWVAVSLLIPIKPVGDIETVRAQAAELAQLVQSQLMSTVFQSDS